MKPGRKKKVYRAMIDARGPSKATIAFARRNSGILIDRVYGPAYRHRAGMVHFNA